MEFPDLACCEADGPDLEDALENASDAAYNWIWSELEEEEDCEIPAASPMDELEQELKEGSLSAILWCGSNCFRIMINKMKKKRTAAGLEKPRQFFKRMCRKMISGWLPSSG